MKNTTGPICAFLVILFYAVGFVGLSDHLYTNLFKQLIPFHLLLMLVLMVISHDDKNRSFWLFLLITYTAGFLVELLGVHTGAIFGDYAYGATLGLKVAETPLMIGVNWILVIYSAGVLTEKFGIESNVLKSLLGALLVTVLDFIIEPVAIAYDFWSWKNTEVPFQNYVGWFVFSFLMFWFFFRMRFRKNNLAAIALFIVQFLFFFVLNMKLL